MTLPAIPVVQVVEPSTSPTPTETETTTPPVTPTTTATVTSTATATQTVTAGPTATVTVTATPTATQTSGSQTPSASTTPTQQPVNIYTTPGKHTVNGREWFTECEPYSQTFRCRTEIWASQVKVVNGSPQRVTGWVFNNLTYLPMARATWAGNPLGNEGAWVASDGRRWYTECDNENTGRNGCRSYFWTSVLEATAPGATTFRQTEKWVFNNIVLFS